MLPEEKMAATLRRALPRICLPHLAEANIALCIDREPDEDDEILGVAIGLDGVARDVPGAVAVAHGWIRGTVLAWDRALSEGDFTQLRAGGAHDLVDAFQAMLPGALVPGSAVA
jgi:hypothetical protein